MLVQQGEAPQRDGREDRARLESGLRAQGAGDPRCQRRCDEHADGHRDHQEPGPGRGVAEAVPEGGGRLDEQRKESDRCEHPHGHDQGGDVRGEQPRPDQEPQVDQRCRNAPLDEPECGGERDRGDEQHDDARR